MSLMQPFQCVKSKYNYFVNQFAVLQKTLLLLLRAVNPNTMTGNHSYHGQKEGDLQALFILN